MIENQTQTQQPDGLPMPQRIFAIIGIWSGIFLSVANNSIANVSLPTIAADLAVDPSTVVWVINAYQLATIMLLLPFAALGEIFGYRRIYLVGVVIFCLSSFVCALSVSFPMLVIGRLLQGLGSAFITCVNTTLVRMVYPKRMLGRGIGLNSAVVATSAAAGPAISGALLLVSGWHILFAVSVPFGLLAFFLGWRYLPRTQKHNDGQHFDFKGSLLSAGSFGLFVLALESMTHGWGYVPASLLVVATLVVGYIYVRNQLDKPFPMLPLDLLHIRLFSLSLLTGICSYLAQMLALIALPFFFQHQLGFSDSQSGLLMTTWPLVIIAVAPLAGFMAERVHAGIMGGIGLTVMAFGLLMLFFLPEHPSIPNLVWRLLLCGAGFALFQSPNNSTIIASAPPERSGSASGMLATARIMGQTIGASLTALMFLLFPVGGARYALVLAAVVALTAAIISCSRLSLQSPLHR